MDLNLGAHTFRMIYSDQLCTCGKSGLLGIKCVAGRGLPEYIR
jgi:hypothetical protein